LTDENIYKYKEYNNSFNEKKSFHL
jgi:hypothetical protein